MHRISRHQMFMQIAHIVAQRSTCFRLNVGAVIVHDRRVVSIGYNGRPAGQPHCTGHTCPGALSCQETTHAEINALKYLPTEFVNNLDMYVTDSPCPSCWFNLLHGFHKFDRVFFGTPYRINDHLKDDSDPVTVYRLTPAGYLIDWRTGELVSVET